MRFLMHPTRAAALRIDGAGELAVLALEGEEARVVEVHRVPDEGGVGALATDGERVFHAHGGFFDELAWADGALVTRVHLPPPIADVDAITPDGRYLVKVSPPARRRGPNLLGIVVFDRSTGRIDTLSLPSSSASPVAFDAGSRRMACLFDDQGMFGVAHWELARGVAPHVEVERDEQDELDLGGAAGLCAFDRRGEVLAAHSVTPDGRAHLHAIDVQRGVERWIRPVAPACAPGTSTPPAVSGDGRLVACGLPSGEAVVLDAASGEVVARPSFGDGPLGAVHFDSERAVLWAVLGAALIGRPLA